MSKRNIVLTGLLVALVAVFSLSLVINRNKLKTRADQSQAAGLVLTGVAVKDTGGPVQGFASLSNGSTMILGKDGSFSFSGLTPKTYVVEIWGFDGTRYGNDTPEFGQIYVGSDQDAINDLVLTNLKPVAKLEGFTGPATDTNPPVITHTSLTTVPAGKDATIPFSVIDREWGKRFGGVNLYYVVNSGNWKLANLKQDTTNQDQFTATIPAADVQTGTTISYYIEASDPIGHISYFPVQSGTNPQANAISITVSALPTPTPTPTATCKVPDSLKADLVACYPLDEGSGTIVHDASGTGNDGTLSGNAKWDTEGCKVKSCLVFVAGGNSKVTIPDNPSLNPDAITVAAWVRPNTKITQSFMQKLDPSDVDKLSYGLTGNNCCLYFSNIGEQSNAYQPNTWIHIVGTAQARHNEPFYIKILYVNGQSIISVAPSDYRNISGPLILGSFAGALDEVMIFNRALTPDEISSLYKQY
ncbi:MAG: LamG domain-containing protein [Patescibacteria group bacterium]